MEENKYEIQMENGDMEIKWSLNWKPHREDGPTLENPYNTELWYKNGELHRENGAAVNRGNGVKEWWQNGKKVTI